MIACGVGVVVVGSGAVALVVAGVAGVAARGLEGAHALARAARVSAARSVAFLRISAV